jgi:hypothetical protein
LAKTAYAVAGLAAILGSAGALIYLTKGKQATVGCQPPAGGCATGTSWNAATCTCVSTGGGGGGPPPGPLTIAVTPITGTTGANTTFTLQSGGWNPNESLVLIWFNSCSGAYVQVVKGTSDASGNWSTTFKVSAALVCASAPGSLYVEDPNSPFPHTGYQSPRTSVTVAS